MNPLSIPAQGLLTTVVVTGTGTVVGSSVVGSSVVVGSGSGSGSGAVSLLNSQVL